MLTKEEFQNRIANGLRILDGATGSNLRQMGMPKISSTEQWILDNPKILQDLQRNLNTPPGKRTYRVTMDGKTYEIVAEMI